MAETLVYRPIKQNPNLEAKLHNVYESMYVVAERSSRYKPINANKPGLGKKMENLYGAMYVQPEPAPIEIKNPYGGTAFDYQPSFPRENVAYTPVETENRPRERKMGGPDSLPPKDRAPLVYSRLREGPSLSQKMDNIWNTMGTPPPAPPATYHRIGKGPSLTQKAENIFAKMASDRHNQYEPVPYYGQYTSNYTPGTMYTGLPMGFADTSSVPGHMGFVGQPHGGTSNLYLTQRLQ